jgi:hypothetical protein
MFRSDQEAREVILLREWEELSYQEIMEGDPRLPIWSTKAQGVYTMFAEPVLPNIDTNINIDLESPEVTGMPLRYVPFHALPHAPNHCG